MSDYQNEVQKLVEGFVSALGTLWKRQIADSLSGMDVGGVPVRRGPGRPRGSTNVGSSSNGGGSNASRRKGEKRTADELDMLADRFHQYVLENPGLRIEQINKELGTSTKDLALPIKKLVGEGMLKGKGEKRSRTYTASEGRRRKSN